jgi:hypothetical protein
MSAPAAADPPASSRHLPPVLVAGAAAGALDILAALALAGARGTGPLTVLKAIASGLFGPEAFRRGTEMAALGLLLHFIIATGWAAVFYAASRRFPVLLRRPVVSGALYGVAVYWLMRLVVLPLSAAPRFGTPTASRIATAIAIHICFVGLPIALVIARASRRRS